MQKQSRGSREPYEPPRIRKIKIIPDELAAGACKQTMIISTICLYNSRLINRLKGS
jgi:hypothetical protein